MEKRTKESQKRTLQTKYETREEPDGQKIIAGYFVVFDSETELWPGAYESIAQEAFDGMLNGDIRALTNHDTTLVLGRNKAGTLKLTKDSRGLWGEITINEKDMDAVNLYERVKRGDVDQCSFGFDILDEEMEWRDDNTVKWTIRKVDLHEVSVCTFPAYEDTGVQARHREIDQHRERQAQKWKRDMTSRLKGGDGAWH